MRLTATIKDGKRDLYLDRSLVVSEPSEITLRSATVYWNYNNIDNDLEDSIVVDGVKVEFKHGYWNFEDIKTELEKKGVSVAKECVTGKCTISVDDTTDFKTFGMLLGLNKNTTITAGSTITSHNMVSVNHGFKSLDISSNIVDRSKNIDDDGKYSDVVTNLPIPTDKTLKGTLSYYHNIDSKVSINRGTYNHLEFKAVSNVNRYAGDVLLEMYISPK